MSEQKTKNPDVLSQEIEAQRLKFKLEAEKIILDSLSESLGSVMGADTDKSAPTSAGSKIDADKDKAPCAKVDLMKIPMTVVSIVYGLILSAVLVLSCHLAWIPKQLDNNVCITLVTILILSTLVLFLAGRYCISMQQIHQAQLRDEKKETPKEHKSEESFKEKALKRTREAVLDMVVEDTIESFRKKK